MCLRAELKQALREKTEVQRRLRPRGHTRRCSKPASLRGALALLSPDCRVQPESVFSPSSVLSVLLSGGSRLTRLQRGTEQCCALAPLSGCVCFRSLRSGLEKWEREKWGGSPAVSEPAPNPQLRPPPSASGVGDLLSLLSSFLLLPLTLQVTF